MAFRLVPAFMVVLLVLACQSGTDEGSERTCLEWSQHVDSLAAVDAADSVLAIVPQALATCSVSCGPHDSLIEVILGHAIDASTTADRYDLMGSYSEQLFVVDSARYGREDRRTRQAQMLVARSYRYQSQLAAAESLLTQIATELEPEREAYAKDYLFCLVQIEVIRFERGHLDEMAALVDSTVRIAEELFGAGHVGTVPARQLQAEYLEYCGRYREAQVVLERLLDQFEPVNDQDSSTFIGALTKLGDINQSLGKYAEAELLYERGLMLQQQLWGEGADPHVLYFALGELLQNQGRYDEAEKYYRRALDIRRSIFGREHRAVAYTLNALGSLYDLMGRYADAERVLGKAHEIYVVCHGADGLHASGPLFQIAMAKLGTGELDEAEQLLRKVLDIRRRTVDSSSILVANVQWELAGVEAAHGRFDVARKLYREGLAARRLRHSSVHPSVFNAVRRMAIMEAQAGQLDTSLTLFAEMRAYYRDYARYIFSFTSEKNKLCWIRKYPLIDDALLTIALANPSREWVDLAYDMVLYGKCAVVDAVAAERLTAYCSDDSRVAELRAEQARVCDAIAPLALGKCPGISPAMREDSLRRLFACRDSLEGELSRLCSSYNPTGIDEAVSASDIAGVLGDSTILLDFVRYSPYDLSLPSRQEQPADWDRYLAFVLSGGGVVRMVDVGSAEDIDSLVTGVRRAVGRMRNVYSPELGRYEEERLSETTRQLYDVLISPLAGELADYSTIRVSPDGMLNLIPLGILRGPDGRYMAEEYCLTYVTSARDLAGTSEIAPSHKEVVVFAAADYDFPGSEQPGVRQAADRGSERSSGYECFSSGFPPLPGTRQEGEMVGRIAREHGWQVWEYYDREASEGAFKRLRESPTVLHVATHGYFCPPTDATHESVLDNPLLRSGLVLAGANVRSGESDDGSGMADDGLLTALEISATDLTGTELVVLSSCESGLGEVADGEGVFGLRRAFRQANCRTLISTLWAVPDEEAADLMASFYRQWLSGTPKGKALQEAALEQLARCRDRYGHGHPALWGGFLLVGSAD